MIDVCFVLFKQKTAYEMRISDWSQTCALPISPEVNLLEKGFIAADRAAERSAGPGARVLVTVAFDKVTDRILADARGKTGRAYYDAVDVAEKALESGRASFRERVWQYG